MLIIEEQFNFTPLVDTAGQQAFLDKIIEYINEYIHDTARRTILKDGAKRVIHLSGLASYHHPRLMNYLQKQTPQNVFHKLEIMHGEFGDTHLKHCWIKADDFIIDLTIKQFKSIPNVVPSFLRRFFDTHCFISNNNSSLIYNLYKPVHE